MTLDAYSYCLCGSGKKLKFCCCKDLLHELETVARAKDGEQHAAALDQAKRLIAQHGARPALLAIQAESALAAEDIEQAESAAKQLLAALPHGSVGLGIAAMVDAAKGNFDGAIENLQQALESVDEHLAGITYSAIAIVAAGLVATGKYLAGRGHLMFQAAVAGDKDSQPVETLMRLAQSPLIPVPIKQEFRYSEAPAGVAWQGEFSAAMKSARRGAWRAACESLESLNQKVPNQPPVLRNIAILRGWLGQESQAVEAWRKYAALPGVPTDDAVEAEALAALLDQQRPVDLIDVVQRTYAVPDTDRLMEFLLSDRRSDSAPVDLSELAEEGQPPPKGAFYLFDRDMPPTLDGISSHRDLPVVVGEAFLYGRQTDRPARLEVVMNRDGQFSEHHAEVERRLAKLVGPLEKEEVVEQISRVRLETAPRCRFPRQSDAAKARDMMKELRRETYVQRWPDIPVGSLDGKTVREAARDANPVLRNRASAAVLNLELASEESGAEDVFDFNELRRTLGLPDRTTTPLSGSPVSGVSLIRMGRLDYSKLSDNELLDCYARLTMFGYRTALFRCGREIVARPSLSDQLDVGRVLETLVSISPDRDTALQFIDMGRQLSAVRGQSQAVWQLFELQIRLAGGEGQEASRLIRLITSQHGKEPGVNDALMELLVRYGVIRPEQMTAQPGGEPGRVSAAPAAAAEVGKIWTPESAPNPTKPESKLWLPGS
jgi:tetratricopeptide (TPR) repeat protein